MISHYVLFLQLLFIPLALSLNHQPNCDLSTPAQGSTLKIFHIDSPCSPFKPKTPLSWEARVLQMLAEDQARLRYLSSLIAGKSNVPVASGRQILQTPTYIVQAMIGTPAQPLLVAMDTSSDFAWFPCTGCIGCPSSTAFSPAKSTTFKNVSCNSAQCKQVPNPTCGGSACAYNLTYGSSSLAGNLSQDTLRLAADPIPAFAFGCVRKVSGGGTVPPLQGLLGLGRGPLSLLSQSQPLYKSTFSYCLPSFRSLNFSGSLRLGPTAQPIRLKFTPLLRNPRRSSLYYVNLVGIRVGPKVVDLPPGALAFNPTTGAGTIIDSGTVFTRLVKPVYEAVRDEFRRRVKPRSAVVTSLGGFDTCYMTAIVAPTVTFMFAGVNMTLPEENMLIHSTAGSNTCLAMAAAPENVNSVVNVIANMQQQNHRVLVDVPNSRLGLAPARCS
ncbi:PREDICTED: aspartyl protease AED3-like [Tarenaya hassleriana]|uniref:aspartyl protease AED3-like n=1 Tax=Tarenaya hassleriana TaxID=28532 RepID=UPI00053C63ED|nr:PREDICTED: aspartyl protease AED3-like [Tarenaya hassleriana]